MKSINKLWKELGPFIVLFPLGIVVLLAMITAFIIDISNGKFSCSRKAECSHTVNQSSDNNARGKQPSSSADDLYMMQQSGVKIFP